MKIFDKLNCENVNIERDKLFKAIRINIIYMVGMIIFFEPILSIDDIAISNYLYGAYQGAYDYHTLYSSFLYGRMVHFFLKILPEIPWYTILVYIWIFIALTLLTYIILCWSNSFSGNLIVHLILLFFSYEGYICIQFTKVAAIVGAVGIFAFTQKKQNKVIRIVGVFLLFLSVLIRRQSAIMIIADWSLLLVINFIIKFTKERKWDKQEIIRQGIRIVIACVIYVLPLVLPKYVSDAEETAWEDFYDWSEARVVFQDYDIPDYDENKEVYDSLGVSKNDLYVWYSWNFDPEGITTEIGGKVGELQPRGQNIIQKVFDVNNIVDFFKTFIRKFEKNDCFFAFVLISIIVGICSNKKVAGYSIAISSFMVILLDYYLYINGRYSGIHRVDVGIMMLGCVMIIYMAMEEAMKSEMEIKKVAGAGLVFLLVVPFRVYADDLPVTDSEQNAINKVFYENTYQDNSHYYVLGNSRSNSGQLRYLPSAFECITPGLYKNVYGITSPSPTIDENLLEYGIENPYTSLADNEVMYLVLDKYDSMKDSLEVYIEEHSDKEVELVLVKTFCDKRIYRVVTKDLNEIMDVDNIKTSDEQIVSDISMQIEENILKLSGNAYLENQNAFSQNVYVQIVDAETGESQLYYTLQSCDEGFSGNYEAYFSGVSVAIQLPDTYDVKDDIYLLIENGGEYFRMEICE